MYYFIRIFPVFVSIFTYYETFLDLARLILCLLKREYGNNDLPLFKKRCIFAMGYKKCSAGNLALSYIYKWEQKESDNGF